MTTDARTIQTYNESAEQFAHYFASVGTRVLDVETAMEFAGNPLMARAVEIGCGDGRDAEEIVKRVEWYEGFDPSIKMIELAKKRNLNASFVEADALSYEYPDDLDLVFAFASLLHVNQESMEQVFGKVGKALRKGGVILVSLKEREGYSEEIQQDEFGERQFYYYDVPTVQKTAGEQFEPVHEGHQKIGSTDWLTLVLRKM